MVTPVENVIRHVRLCAEIERFSEIQKAVVTRLLSSDEPVMHDVLDELEALRGLEGGSTAAIGARVTRIEEYVNASRLLKSMMIERLKRHDTPNVVVLPVKTAKRPLQWAKKPAHLRSEAVVALHPAKK